MWSGSHHNCHNNFIMTKKKAARMKTSPNNASGIIWAQVSFIYSPFVLFDANKCFIVSTGCIYDIHEREWVGRPETTKTGPNNVSHIVWAPGESFSTSFVLFDTKQISTGSKLRNTRHPKRSEARDALHLELQVNHYHLTPLGQTGARDALCLEPR